MIATRDAIYGIWLMTTYELCCYIAFYNAMYEHIWVYVIDNNGKPFVHNSNMGSFKANCVNEPPTDVITTQPESELHDVTSSEAEVTSQSPDLGQTTQTSLKNTDIGCELKYDI